MSPQTRVHNKWGAVVRGLSLDLREPVNFVTAKQIKQLSEEEPRIMAKMDSRKDLPAEFRNNGVFVLPMTNRSYALVRGNGYHDLETIHSTPASFPSALPYPLVSSTIGLSEMQYVDLAYNTGLLEHFIGVDSLFLNVRGRKFSPAFDFKVDGSPVLHVEGVQVEIDGGLEGEHTFVALEAKINWGGDFIVRQLYYPFRFWEKTFQSLGVQKEVRPVFFVYDASSATYNFWEYRFTDLQDYESIELVRSARFKITPKSMEVDQFRNVKADSSSERRKIVPQADDVSKIAEVPFLAHLGFNSAKRLAAHFGFALRQGSYYSQAAEALGLIQLRGGRYDLTGLGEEFLRKPAPDRHELLARLMLQIPIFNEALAMMIVDRHQTINGRDLGNLIRKRGYTGSTLGRRTRTLFAWFEWMEQRFGIVEVRDGKVSLRRKQSRLPE